MVSPEMRPSLDPPPGAVLFDLDGTLYHQPSLRRAMAWELVRAGLRAPLRTARTARRLRAFRSAREELRDVEVRGGTLEGEQYALPARRLGVEPGVVRAAVEEWMMQRPLPHLAASAWLELRQVLEELRRRGARLGVFSDYPPEDKLRALDIRSLFDVALGATDPAIDEFKPGPAGLLRAAAELGVDPADVVYVGDRVDVDAPAAQRAGMRCVIVGAEASAVKAPLIGAPRFRDLPDLLLANVPPLRSLAS